MVSRENKIILLFGTAGMALAYGGRVVTDLDDTVLIGVLLFVGILLPQIVNSYLDKHEGE